VIDTRCQLPAEGHYAAVTYSIYDANTSTINPADSGLAYPLVVRAGQPTFLDIGGIPLGLFPDSKYQETQLQPQTGDLLIFYSDGVVEMRNDTGEEFGLRRLAETVRSNNEKSANDIVKSISADLDE